ncbi:hypothetical protein GEMRC1_001676 [Eukaryota sp. GEM-RC1]
MTNTKGRTLAGTKRRSGRTAPARQNSTSAPNRPSNPNKNRNPPSNRRDFFTDHSNNPIQIPDIFGKPRPDHVRSIREMLARSDPELQRQGRFLFDETYQHYYAKCSTPDEKKQAKRMRSAWVDANTNNHNRFLILKHWDSRHQMVKEPILLVTRTDDGFVAQQTHSWTLFRRSSYASPRRGSAQMKMKGFIQEFCIKLQSQFTKNRPKWESYLWQGYCCTKHMSRMLNDTAVDSINNQIFTLFMYVFEYHRIDVSDIFEFAGIERNQVLTAGHLGDARIFLPRYILEKNPHSETCDFSDHDREICGEWNLSETRAFGTEILNAYRAVRL